MTIVIDKTGMFAPADIKRLEHFIVGQCFSYLRDREWLKRVEIRDDGQTDYFGYWIARVKQLAHGRRELEALIVLNATYLKTVEALERTLAHEYGHNWSLGYLIDRELLTNMDRQRLPGVYYRIRHLNSGRFRPNDSKGWNRCDKEVLAEDYRCLMTPYHQPHRMLSTVGPPSAEVRIFLERIGRLDWRR